ncbi:MULTISPECIES: 23S rRNA (uracil(1939)-C(5))-methyltransferase RlmD [Okeania]|uniref:23S rRNA (Uracil(1939)-C(5))-methyltransferase RlmD n=1 Tax=Okeania hirsuta TaxID=1458930 RepID=A0A3N6PXW2_9CYAN|nr:MULTISPECIES: 23S rRNA (uracil(1939)-C(5))-methyltransferase RlmD [Okeania]NES88416.1 23S rRNA (uracil(1939)-C(5))-methyltransferase RlmD [Okeania sp. SIO2B9]NET79816.1 23S rRNA (uracil(1939)-C(5))-methyltransferase RlmD [Okeania sp. SIO1F9]RQH21673.1 23S rRNA (uracil(1939)-C(5))-methyltransferase RlmD [Okeania hirsuta]RQH53534.1 23S rRNA (uracil(1939)-C(5))-methyltransferase RlmD [Okeania hirsuta]
MNINNQNLAKLPCEQGQLVEITITDLTDSGDGVGRYGQKVIFVPDTVPGDRLVARLTVVKPKYAYGKLHQLLETSKYRIKPYCIVADKCGGCQWQHISYEYQLQVKQNQVIQALKRIGGLTLSAVDPTLASPAAFGYRNKATYPLSISTTGQVKAGYYQKGSHKVINLNQCPIQDERLNPLLKEVKQDITRQGWKIYDEQKHTGIVRHLSLRIGNNTGEILLTLVINGEEEKTKELLPGIEAQAQKWLENYSRLVGVCLNYNSKATNTIFGQQTVCVAGRLYLYEEFSGLKFQLTPDTFFQVNTKTAEKLMEVVIQELALNGREIIVDAYCGIGTFTLPIAKYLQQVGVPGRDSMEIAGEELLQGARKGLVIGIEVQPMAIKQAQLNAETNHLTNVIFHDGKVEDLLPELQVKPDVVLLDPPRKGCDRSVLETLLEILPERIVYISCKPPTLARDLKFLCSTGKYELSKVQPADFFPQTAHVECAAFLVRKKSK